MPGLSPFKRITSTGNFIPEIDGLRFVAIVSVVLCHLTALIAANAAVPAENGIFNSAAAFLLRGRFGVQLFFVISGLILGIPFCRKRMQGEKNLHLKEYYLRRLSRIEPPYMLVMIVLFFANVFVAHTLDIQKGFTSLVCSLLYSHNFVYGRHIYPYLTTVAWSLEIEIQFYLLVPVLSMIFLIRNTRLRRGLMIIIIIAFTFLSDLAQFSFLSLYDFIQYFMVGFLLADLYYHKQTIKKFALAPVLGYVALMGIWLFEFEYLPTIWGPFWHIAQLGFVFLFYYVVLFQNGFKWLKNELIYVIGGMCYSIYLLHYPLISLFGNYLTQFSLTGNLNIDSLLYTLFILLIILLSSAVFFVLIERPCMKRYWYRDLYVKLKNMFRQKPSVT